ncbi:MAG TPA: tripartite tricarboxylate transporter substrate binding protein [Xanthobacteraceae bacterium]|nr:tripartite tricarboxylate transporter substrate binding protein [Xanthobacteraceae bacterium]
MTTLARSVAALALPFALVAAHAQEAQDFPSRTIKLVVPASPGGPIDAVARILADGLKTVWPSPVVVENRAGAGTSTGAAFVAAAPPDGYTLLVMPDSITVNPYLYPNVNPDPLKSFEPIALIATATQLLVVRPGLGVGGFNQFLDYARHKGTDVNMASAGTATLSHLTEVLLEQRTGIATTHIPFKGAAPALTAMLGAHVDAMWVMPAPAVPHLRSGRLLGLAVTSAARDPNLPGVPTVEESGIADFRVDNWQGLFAPAETPKPIVDKIGRAVIDVVKTPEVKSRMAAIGFEPRGDGPDTVVEIIRTSLPKWADVIRRSGLKLAE